MLRRTVLLVIVVLPIVKAQDCRFYGQSCSDDYSCCGGCCFKDVCKDTYIDCKSNELEDPCQDRYCPEDQICVTYQPRGCKGCGALVECRTVSKEYLSKDNATITHHHFFSSSGSSWPNWNIMFTAIGMYCLSFYLY
ncbi:uncharacterized protein LOC143194990 [Rhynchophorus ferrugineus]|uniref:Uncharacterized protein n=1 Tax=Rhynchophorus ferrugineus TaxID=354439 RepID=A0A834IZE8_RHYFE|nr:hypothetical protein GWI33_003180 [Rhynchophorus ferrugineus]